MNYVDIVENLKFDTIELTKEYNTHIKNLMREQTNTKVLVQLMFPIIKNGIKCREYDLLIYTKAVVDKIASLYKFTNIVYRIVMPNTAYNWHVDNDNINIHIPLFTNIGCYMVYPSKSYHMPADGSVYLVKNNIHHTFVNAGPDPRCHLIFST